MIGLVFVAALKHKASPYKDLSKSIERVTKATLQLKHIYYTNTNKEAKKEWELFADSAQYFKDKKIVMLKNIKAKFYTKDGEVYTISGKEGKFEIDTHNISLSGGIVGYNKQGDSFITNSIYYWSKQRKITSNDKVVIQSKRFVLEGKGLVIELEKEQLRLLRDIKAKEMK